MSEITATTGQVSSQLLGYRVDAVSASVGKRSPAGNVNPTEREALVQQSGTNASKGTNSSLSKLRSILAKMKSIAALESTTHDRNQRRILQEQFLGLKRQLQMSKKAHESKSGKSDSGNANPGEAVKAPAPEPVEMANVSSYSVMDKLSNQIMRQMRELERRLEVTAPKTGNGFGHIEEVQTVRSSRGETGGAGPKAIYEATEVPVSAETGKSLSVKEIYPPSDTADTIAWQSPEGMQRVRELGERLDDHYRLTSDSDSRGLVLHGSVKFHGERIQLQDTESVIPEEELESEVEMMTEESASKLAEYISQQISQEGVPFVAGETEAILRAVG